MNGVQICVYLYECVWGQCHLDSGQFLPQVVQTWTCLWFPDLIPPSPSEYTLQSGTLEQSYFQQPVHSRVNCGWRSGGQSKAKRGVYLQIKLPLGKQWREDGGRGRWHTDCFGLFFYGLLGQGREETNSGKAWNISNWRIRLIFLFAHISHDTGLLLKNQGLASQFSSCFNLHSSASPIGEFVIEACSNPQIWFECSQALYLGG